MLSKPVEVVVTQIDGGKFTLPLDEIVSQVSPEALELEHTFAEEQLEGIPDIFHEEPIETEPSFVEEVSVQSAEPEPGITEDKVSEVLPPKETGLEAEITEPDEAEVEAEKEVAPLLEVEVEDVLESELDLRDNEPETGEVPLMEHV